MGDAADQQLPQHHAPVRVALAGQGEGAFDSEAFDVAKISATLSDFLPRIEMLIGDGAGCLRGAQFTRFIMRFKNFRWGGVSTALCRLSQRSARWSSPEMGPSSVARTTEGDVPVLGVFLPMSDRSSTSNQWSTQQFSESEPQ